MTEVHMFWAYGDLGRLERICARSFLRLGYEINLWTYGQQEPLTNSMNVFDARDILPESAIFKNKLGSYASFADWFRYSVLQRHGGIYSDTDVIALADPEVFTLNTLVTERLPDGKQVLNNNLIAYFEPEDGSLIDLCLAVAERFKKDEITWGELGPQLLTSCANLLPNHGFQVKPPNFANPIDCWLSPGAFLTSTMLPEDTGFLHLYNERWRQSGINKEAEFPEGSLLSVIQERFSLQD